MSQLLFKDDDGSIYAVSKIQATLDDGRTIEFRPIMTPIVNEIHRAIQDIRNEINTVADEVLPAEAKAAINKTKKELERFGRIAGEMLKK